METELVQVWDTKTNNYVLQGVQPKPEKFINKTMTQAVMGQTYNTLLMYGFFSSLKNHSPSDRNAQYAESEVLSKKEAFIARFIKEKSAVKAKQVAQGKVVGALRKKFCEETRANAKNDSHSAHNSNKDLKARIKLLERIAELEAIIRD